MSEIKRLTLSKARYDVWSNILEIYTQTEQPVSSRVCHAIVRRHYSNGSAAWKNPAAILGRLTEKGLLLKGGQRSATRIPVTDIELVLEDGTPMWVKSGEGGTFGVPAPAPASIEPEAPAPASEVEIVDPVSAFSEVPGAVEAPKKPAAGRTRTGKKEVTKKPRVVLRTPEFLVFLRTTYGGETFVGAAAVRRSGVSEGQGYGRLVELLEAGLIERTGGERGDHRNPTMYRVVPETEKPTSSAEVPTEPVPQTGPRATAKIKSLEALRDEVAQIRAEIERLEGLAREMRSLHSSVVTIKGEIAEAEGRLIELREDLGRNEARITEIGEIDARRIDELVRAREILENLVTNYPQHLEFLGISVSAATATTNPST